MAMESIMLLGHVNFSMNNMRKDRIKKSLQKDLLSLSEADNPPTTLLLGDDLPKKIREAKESSNLLHIPYLNQYDTQDIKTRKTAAKQRITFCPRATNIEHEIDLNTKTTDNAGINKYSKYKACRHTIYQGILQIQR